MNKLYRPILCGALLLIARHSTLAQVPPLNCVANAPAPPTVRAEGRAELVSDIVITCTGGNPAVKAAINITVTLNTNVTSNLTGPGPDETEALVLIDEPMPAPALNMANGFAFVGQVKGTPSVIPSGNVFTGLRTASPNQLLFPGIPIVPPGVGHRIFRITNVRAVPPPPGPAGGSPILAALSISGPISVPLISPVVTVGFTANGLSFTHAPMGSNQVLKFSELFPSAFKKRIENGGGPLVAVKQNHPGVLHCTESGFNPDFTPVTPAATGSANTGTRLVTRITGIPFFISSVIVPTNVPSGQITAAVVPPPNPSPYATGIPLIAPGTTAIPVSGGAATIVYEVVAAAPYAGINGCGVLNAFSMTVQPWPFGSLAAATVTGFFGPQDPTPIISAPSPEPRFK
jgi:hypothetical protein